MAPETAEAQLPEGAEGPAGGPGRAPDGSMDDAPRRRRRGRTAMLLAGAAVLGVVAGTCTGYVEQAGRTPTPLPPLSQPVVKQAKGGAEPLSAAQDRRVKTDGDLRKLLISRPSGARNAPHPVGDDGWMALLAYAENYEKPDEAFTDQIASEFRRAAITSWRTSDTHYVEIRLVQYRQEEDMDAVDQAENQVYWAERESGSHGWPIPGTGDGMAYVDSTPDRKPGYLAMYSAEAHAWRGDIAVDIFVADTKAITKKEIMSLAERQMGRL
ncbi:hypothetical protein [Streptomyces chiangmaiensis]|uniref:Lipoprotein n=1 Tax=Streptomyces chiangmaiensis TaxID=766497 RepID=A0ABU7FF27_9ACTN|nr:hypothetical protein [Streptomyces chiangmaiensis]MED7822505.1 hypothetical protein [Streptomyces chiangmaiensis]